MSAPLPRCITVHRRRPLDVVLGEALRAAFIGLIAAWGLAELVLAVQGL